nr:lipid A deacylase LpxR family protein [Roseomonas sp. HF4]
MPPPPDAAGTLSFGIENDVLGGTDRYYTNGLQIAWRSPSADLPAPLAWLNRQLDFLQGPGELRWGLALGQSIFTPQDTALYDPDPTDRPYAGYLYGALSLSRVTAMSLSVLEIQAGIVGPSAGGKFVQNGWHSVIGVAPSNGWDHQLSDEPTVALILERKWRVPLAGDETLGLELLPSVSGSVGNLQTYAAAGALLRVGRNLAADFGPPRIRPALAGSAFFQPQSDEFGWYVFGGVEGRAVARDIFLDGNTWAESRSVISRPLVADLQAGVAVIPAMDHDLRGGRLGDAGCRGPDRPPPAGGPSGRAVTGDTSGGRRDVVLRAALQFGGQAASDGARPCRTARRRADRRPAAAVEHGRHADAAYAAASRLVTAQN